MKYVRVIGLAMFTAFVFGFILSEESYAIPREDFYDDYGRCIGSVLPSGRVVEYPVSRPAPKPKPKPVVRKPAPKPVVHKPAPKPKPITRSEIRDMIREEQECQKEKEKKFNMDEMVRKVGRSTENGMRVGMVMGVMGGVPGMISGGAMGGTTGFVTGIIDYAGTHR